MDYSEFSWLIALGLIVGLSFAIMYILNEGFKTFFVFFLIFSGFCLYAYLIDLWIIILLFIINSIILIIQIKNKRSGI